MRIADWIGRVPARVVALVMAAAFVSACGGDKASEVDVAEKPAPVTQARLENADSDAGNWLLHGRTYSEQRFSPLQQVTEENIDSLELAWWFEMDSNRGVESTPLVVDGVMYVTSAWSIVYALDAKTGQRLWTYDPEVPKSAAAKACCDVVNRGVAFWKGRVYVASLDGRLIAIDAKSGARVWETLTVDPDKPYTITGAPRVAEGLIFIGNGGAEYGVRGYVSAYDADTGDRRWRFYTVPGNPDAPADGEASDAVLKDVALETWTGEWWKYGGGGTAWDSIVYDPDTGYLFIGVGNGSPHDRNIRSPEGGDNLFLSSIVAVEAKTGKYVWHYQTTPGDSWDFTATQQIMLFDGVVDGQSRKLLWQAPKNGFFYVIDRVTGELISAEPYTTVSWAEKVDPETGRPVEAPGVRYESGTVFVQPAVFGGHNWQAMSFSPDTGLVYIPALDTAVPWSVDPMYEYRPGWWNTGSPGPRFPSDPAILKQIRAGSKSFLRAWNPMTQEEAWSVELVGPWNGGTLATAGNLVFQGTADGRFEAYRASDGQKLWERATNTATLASPISYSVDGEQYVAVPGGFGTMLFLALPIVVDVEAIPNQRGRVLVYKLGGEAKLPVEPAIKKGIPELPDIDASDAVLARGGDVYQYYCWQCHGANAVSAGVLPDLRKSPMLLSEEGFKSVVIDGALSEQGMRGFGEWLDADDAEALRAYIVSESRQSLGIAMNTNE